MPPKQKEYLETKGKKIIKRIEEINEAKAQYQRMQFMYKLALEIERVEEDMLDL